MQYLWSEKHQRKLWHILVPGRDNIEVHIGNFPKDTDGCVLCGTAIAGDSVTGSHGAFDKFELMLKPFQGLTLLMQVSDA